MNTIYTTFAKRVFFLLFTLLLSGGSALGATWKWTASDVNELGSNTSNAITLNGKAWTTNRSNGTNQGQLQSGCIQIGANGAAQTITLKSSAFTGKILRVAVECASYQSYHSVAISVGGTSYLSATPTPKWTTVGSKEGTGESSGEIQISFTKNNNSARALYLKSITIEYDESFVEDDEPVYSCGWIATDINNISSTDLVVITMTNSSGTYAMSNDKGTSAAPSAKQVTVLDNILDCDIDDNIKWNVSNNNGTLTIYPNGTTDKWLYCTNTNNGVRVGTGDAKQFTLKSGYLYEDGTTDARYIGVYNSQDWRCYTSINSNIEDQTLKFYKYVPCGPTETTITLHPNGGTPNEEQEITTEEESYTLPECPFSRTGYTFDGWATSANGNVIYENKETIENLNGTAVNLYAKWTPIQYDITYNLNGGTNHASNPAKYTIETSAITLQSPTKTGYTFGGWYKEDAFTTPVTEITEGSTGNITLYAQWTPNTYTVQFNANDGTGEMEDQAFTYDAEPTSLSANIFERVGYNFNSWNTAQDGMGTRYNDEAKVQNLTAAANGVVTLYAQWTAKKLINYRTLCTYNIEYTNLEGATHSNPDTYTAADLPLTFTAPSAREGYTFKGWEPATLGTETRGDQTVTAQWTAHTYSVIFKANGGTGSMDDQQFTYDVEQALSANQFTRVGYTFAGWNDNASGNSTSYTDQQVVKNLSSAKNGQRTLYAQWTANTNTPYVVEHYKQQLDGTYPPEADDTDNLTGTTASSVTPEVKSYEGFTAPSTQTVSIAADGSTVVTYQYTRNSYNLSWDVNSGDALTGEYTSGSVKYGASITQPNTPTRIGYTFANWSPEVPATMPAGDATYTAQWQLIQYTITWSVGGSTTTSIVSVETPLSLPTSPANNALGCCADAFIGWSVYAQPTKEQVFNDVANAPEIDENKTFHAVFATTTLTEGSATATFNEMGYTNAEKVTEIALGDGEGHGDATILFAKDQSASNYPAYYTASGALHAYAKNTITINSTSATSTITNVQFTFAAKEDGSNTISANVGTYADGTWSGSAESVVFTIGGETGHRKITSITVTTQAVEQYTNYVTKCTYGNSPTLGAATVTYNSGDGIDVRCEQTSTMNKAATLTFPNAADLTCPITLTASAGFLISTSKSNDAGYQTSLTVSPYKSGSAQAGKLRTIYVRANATGKTQNYSGTITISGGEVAEQTITVNANVNCQGYILTLKDHLGNTIGTPTSHYEGDIIELPTELEEDACSENYTFDGWSTAPVEYGSLIYNKVSFLYTMPAEDVTLYPVYQCNKTADYHRVTSDLGADNWAGDYLIAANDQTFANGSKGGIADYPDYLGGNNSVVNPGNDLDGNIVKEDWGDQYKVAFINIGDGYYVLQTQDGKYNYINDGATSAGLSATDDIKTASVNNHPLSIIFDETNNSVRITNPFNTAGLALKWMSGTNSFRFGKSPASIYLYKKSPLYTSYLACGTIDVTGNEVYVTATQNRGVMAPEVLTVTAEGMYPNANVILTSNSSDVYFSIDRTANFEKVDPNKPKTSLSLNADADGKLQQDIYVHYKPGTTGNGVPADVVVTAKSDNLPISDDQTIHVRNLPAQFVIATKVGSHWYALPADMTRATNPEGVLIKVDETEMKAEAPTTTVYTLFPVRTTNGTADRYEGNGERVRFSAVNNGNKGLWANNAIDVNTINNDAVIAYVTDGSTDASYEWKITTTVVDGNWQYTLQTDQQNNTNYLRYWPAATGGPKWGTYASGNGNNQLYFLPVTTTYTEMDLEVMEWGTNSMVWRIEQNAPTKVNIKYNSITQGGLSVTQIDNSDLYLVTGYNLLEKDCGILTIIDYVSGARKIIRIPILVNEEKLGSEYTTSLGRDVCADCDIVILNGGKLTADEAKSTGSHVDFANIYVYPGGKLVLDENSLGVKQQVYLRGGYSWLNQSTYALPEVYLNGDINFNGSGNIIYDYYIQNYKYYQFALPYDVQLAKVTDEAGIDNFPVWVKHYNGALRAADPHATSWEWYPNENGDAKAYFKAGEGYIIAAQPRQVGNTANRPLSIIRFPLGNKAFNSTNGIETDLTITTTAHGIDGYNAGTVTANNVGWNFIGNPFMATWKGDIGYKQLAKHPDENNWDGTYHWVDSDVKYITIMSAESGSDYKQYIASNTELKPFFPFYLQETAVGRSGEITFATSQRIQKAPAMLLSEQPRKAFIQIEIIAEEEIDQTGLFVCDKYSDDIDFDDYEKLFGSSIDKPKLWLLHEDKRMAFEAMTESTAATYIPLGYRAPKIGKYIFAINEEASKVSEVEAVYLTDNQTGVTDFDLLSSAYEFESNGELYNDSRFTIRIVLRDESSSTVTGVDNVLHFNSDHPYKFIYQDKMYILRNGVIYDAMGKQVQTINK